MTHVRNEHRTNQGGGKHPHPAYKRDFYKRQYIVDLYMDIQNTIYIVDVYINTVPFVKRFVAYVHVINNITTIRMR